MVARVSSAFAPKRNKYGAIKTTINGLTFDSKGEALRYNYLRLRQLAGEISDLECQVTYDLAVAGVSIAKFKPDFRYRRGGALVVEDFKSPATMTQVFRLKRKLFEALYGIKLEIVQ